MIPQQRVSTENLPFCDHAVCNQKGSTLTPQDVDFVINCLKDQKIIVQDGAKFRLAMIDDL